jgi:hypothetical protein
LVLSHPLLEGVARRLSGQWQTTLGLAAVPELVDADRLLQSWNSGQFDLLLDVVDLDDGSLQDLWSGALGGRLSGGSEPPSAAQLTDWEGSLRRELPYLPLLANLHHVLAPGEGGAEKLRQVCPGCAPAGGPDTGDR